MSAYIDTSFLAALYCPEINSMAAAQSLQALETVPHFSELVEIEFVNALELRVSRKQLSRKQVDRITQDFDDDLGTGRFRFQELSRQAFRRAREIARRTTATFGTRTADILHVAAALELGADTFYSFDRQQRTLAQSMRLRLNPFG